MKGKKGRKAKAPLCPECDRGVGEMHKIDCTVWGSTMEYLSGTIVGVEDDRGDPPLQMDMETYRADQPVNIYLNGDPVAGVLAYDVLGMWVRQEMMEHGKPLTDDDGFVISQKRYGVVRVEWQSHNVGLEFREMKSLMHFCGPCQKVHHLHEKVCEDCGHVFDESDRMELELAGTINPV